MTVTAEPEQVVRPRRRWWRLGVVAAGAVLAAFALHGRLPGWPDVWAAIYRASLAWIALGALLHFVSMWAFAEQHRRLLANFGVRLPAAESLSITYVRSAMSISLPAGAAVSTGYAFKRFRARGADNHVATAVMVLSGVASIAGLAVLYGADLVAWAGPGTSRWPVFAIAVGAIGAGVVLVQLARKRASRSATGPTSTVPPDAPPSRVARIVATGRDALRLAATVTVRQWLVIGGLGVVNWLAEAVCLLASLRAVGLAVPVVSILTAYLAMQLIRQVPVTPGGVGVIEASLLVALTAAGAAQVPAAAAILIYRVLTCWSILPVGFGLVMWQQRDQRAASR